MTTNPVVTRTIIPPAQHSSAEILANLQAARTQVADAGSGKTYLRIDTDTGDITFGQDRTPLPPNHRFAVPMFLFEHGYTVHAGAKITERHLVPMSTNPVAPTPPNGQFVDYGDDGPRRAFEFELHSVDRPGFVLAFTSWSISHNNRIATLLDRMIVHATATPEGKAGFEHPVIVVKAGSYYSPKKKGQVHHFDYEIVDWLHTDGSRLLTGELAAAAELDTAAELDELEAELFGASARSK